MTTAPGQGFLKFNSLPPRIHVTADDDEFDEVLLQHLREEGFDVTYLPYGNNVKTYVNELKHLVDDLELGENCAIIAFNSAATTCLDFHIDPQPKISALICYYPTQIPSPKTKFPPHLQVCVHLASPQNFAPAFEKCYTYSKVLVGFAESDLETYDKVAASLAWTRTLGTLRRAFKVERDLEPIKEDYAMRVFGGRKDAKAVMEEMVRPTNESEPYLNCVPTMAGGIGEKDLLVFYRDYFIPQNPPSLHIKLVSRTVGVDRVVDEMVISFKHTQVMAWILPSVQPTNKSVHVAVVSIVKLRGGKLVHEHLYWDQASVLVQVGLLDPKLVPENFRRQGLKQLPVVGMEAASKILDEESQPSNGLLADWKHSIEHAADESTKLPQRPKQAANVGKVA